jgi:hypothetical protein
MPTLRIHRFMLLSQLLLLLLLLLGLLFGLGLADPAAPPQPAVASRDSTSAPTLDKQETTLLAYLRGGNLNITKASNDGGRGNDDGDDDDLADEVADTPVGQSGAGATVTGAQTGSMVGTGELAYESLGGV